MMGKKGYLHHPFVWILVAFVIGMLVMWLMTRGIIPTAGLLVCS